MQFQRPNIMSTSLKLAELKQEKLDYSFNYRAKLSECLFNLSDLIQTAKEKIRLMS